MQLARGEHELAKTGNWREIQSEDNHGVILLTTEEMGNPVTALGIILFILIGVALSLMATLYMSIYTDKDYTTDVEMVMKGDKGFSEVPDTARSNAAHTLSKTNA